MKHIITGNAHAYGVRAVSGRGWYVYYRNDALDLWIQGARPLSYLEACRAIRDAKCAKESRL
jgi:hypothetical protein